MPYRGLMVVHTVVLRWRLRVISTVRLHCVIQMRTETKKRIFGVMERPFTNPPADGNAAGFAQ